MAVEIPHFALPLRYANGAPVVNEQDSIDDIAACVEAVLRHPRGHRPEQPDFGVTDATFAQGGADLDVLRAEVAEWEDRAEILFERDPERLTGLLDEIAVTVGG
jgi:phage baseplate assembly protein W